MQEKKYLVDKLIVPFIAEERTYGFVKKNLAVACRYIIKGEVEQYVIIIFTHSTLIPTQLEDTAQF